MKVFVVVSFYMNGKEAEKVFSSKEAALAYMSNQNEEGGNPQIEEFLVRGKIENSNFVYTAASYDRPNDIHYLDGIYGNYDEANEAAGKQGLVLRREVNS